MKLPDYYNSLSLAERAEFLKDASTLCKCSQNTVRGWVYGEKPRKVPPLHCIAISILTKKQVLPHEMRSGFPRDFFDRKK